MIPTFKITTEEQYQDTGIRGSVAHRPTLGDFLTKTIKINGIAVFSIIEGKTTNKYTGRYQSYTRVDEDDAFNSIMNFISNYQSQNGLLVSKNNKDIAKKIFEIGRYYGESFSVRKNGEYLGCKVVK